MFHRPEWGTSRITPLIPDQLAVMLVVEDNLEKSVSMAGILGGLREPPTPAGKFILRAYAQKLRQGHRDTDDEERYKGTALEPVMREIRSDEDVAEYWSRG